MAVPKEWYAKHIINNYSYHMWQNAMRMAIEERQKESTSTSQPSTRSYKKKLVNL